MFLRNWTLKRWVIVGLAFLFVLLAGIKIHLKWKVHRAVSVLEDQGTPTQYVDLNKRYGLREGAPNLGIELNKAMDLFSKHDAKRSSNFVTVKLPELGYRFSVEDKNAVSNFFSLNSEAMKTIGKALTITNASYYEEYHQESVNPLALTKIQQATRYLGFKAVFEASKGNMDLSIESLRNIFKLGRSLTSEPTTVDHLVGYTVNGLGLEFMKQVVSLEFPNPDQVNILRSEVAKLNMQLEMVSTIQGKRVFFLEPAYYKNGNAWVSENYVFCEPISNTKRFIWEKLKLTAYRMSGFADRDILFYLKAVSQIESAAMESLEKQAQLVERWPSWLPEAQDYSFCFWSKNALPTYKGLLEVNINFNMRLQAADAALGSLQYRHDHSEIPESLEQLVPEYLDEVSIDPRSGEPFRLIRTENGFGVGRDEIVFEVKWDL